MKKIKIVEIIASLFILLFVYTAMSKIFEPEKFRWALNNSPLIGNYSKLISWCLPLVELIVAALLFIPKKRKAGLFGSLGLMTIFTVYIAFMIMFTPHLPCSCGGIMQQLTWREHLAVNVGFVLFAVLAILVEKQQKNLKRRNMASNKMAYD